MNQRVFQSPSYSGKNKQLQGMCLFQTTWSLLLEIDTPTMKAILKIAHAKIEDAGLYKCVLTAFGKTDFKRIKITVEG